MEIQVLGIDLAKNVFQLHGVDRRGRAIYKRRVFREQLLSVVGDIPRCRGVFDACIRPEGGSPHRGRSAPGNLNESFMLNEFAILS
jgi:hypothetical protein